MPTVAISPQREATADHMLAATTGMVLVRSPVRIRAKRNSFQEKIKVKIMAVKMPGRDRGSTTRIKEEMGPQPSNFAAS